MANQTINTLVEWSVGIILGVVLIAILRVILKRLSRQFEKKGFQKTFKLIILPLTVGLFSLIIIIMSEISPLELPVDKDYLKVIVSIWTNFVVTWLIINLIRSIKYLILQEDNLKNKDNLKARKMQTQLIVLERVLIFIVLLIAFSLALMNFSVIKKIGATILASAGVAGIIIGFAAQKSLQLLLAGIQIAITQPIRMDDVVIVEGEWGWIEEINLTYVVIRIWDKRRLVVPINYFIEKPFQNWTRTNAEILGTVFMYVEYGFPVDELRNELSTILQTSNLWDGKVNVIQVTELKESNMELRILVSATDSPSAWDLRVLLREKLIDFVKNKYPEYLPKTRIKVSQDKTES